ncbi:Uncharacterized protein Rs2_10453 [Raphanus sativus]|nr:Uncharacterized protein Rs2_10453 [Raphanus sativus]
MTQALDSSPAVANAVTTTQFGTLAEIESITTVPATGNPKPLTSQQATTSSNPLEKQNISLPDPQITIFKIIQPNHNSPVLSNPASSNHILPANPTIPLIPTPTLNTTSTYAPHPPAPLPVTNPTLADTLRLKGDKTLQKLAPVTISDTGRPRVLIPDSVFEKGAELHRDFIICYFNGRPPPFKKIQGVLSHMWGKGRRLEMHNNPLQRSVLVRIPSDYLRQKILDKNIWYVGDSMFHTAQWSSVHSSATPPLKSIKIWAHLTGVPLDLRYKQGLSLVAGLIGEPKETDDFTLNLVSLTLSHVKVEVDLTKSLPNVVEFQRHSGEIVEVVVEYPWLPPTCSHCQELGHVIRNCLLYTPPKDAPPIAKVPVAKEKQKMSDSVRKTPSQKAKSKQYVPKSTIPPISAVQIPPSPQSLSLPTSPSAFKTPSFVKTPSLKYPTPTESPLDKPQKPSLKRTRSSPTFSPPAPPKISYQSSNPAPSFPEHYLSNHSSDEDGRIVLIWKDPAKVTVISQSRQMITCELQLPNCQPIIYSAIYASNLSEERTDLWVELLNQHSALALDTKPWMIGGDFNQILRHYEHSSFCHMRHSSQMFQFRDSLLQLGVFDLRYYGPVHTWTNKCDTAPVAKKLDRCLINSECLTSFPNATANFLPPAPSDHTPCLIDLAFHLPKAGTQPFRFLNYLTKHPSFLEVVINAWLLAGNVSANLASLCWKLKNIKTSLKTLNKENFSSIQQRVSESYRLLQLAQVQALADPTPLTFAEEQDLNLKWQFLRQIEECFFLQKSRINWLREGDLKTTYFHRVCQVRASFNAIRSFLLLSGVTITDPLQMSAHAISHFQAVLGPAQLPLLWYTPTEWFCSLTPFRCSQQQTNSFLLMPSADEITKLMFSLNPNKAPGPDGLTSKFFTASWSLLGSECINSLQEFFNSGFLPKTTNSTILSLVLKFTGASKITDYRPISCLNTLYKVISRLLVRRLKPILHQLILPNQTAFVEGRLLVENTVLASELVNGYHRNTRSKKITVKVDIAKAFDTLSWEFLFAALESLHLPVPFLRLLKACICTTTFMVGYNGTVSGFFKGRRGLRQGDPLSPYLFVIVMNYLSLMLDKEARSGNVTYHHHCAKTRLTHLSFADDLLIFIDGSLESVQRVLQILHEFEKRSGLAVSLQKSSFFASGLPDQEISAIQVSTGMPCGSLPMRYLGVPLCTKKLNLQNCESLLQQIKQRLSSWSGELGDGHTYQRSGRTRCKRPPQLEPDVYPQAHLDALLSSQLGLGLLVQRGNLRGDLSNYWTVRTSLAYSWLVNKMIKVRDVIYPLLRRRVGNGESTRFWFDNWTPMGELHTFLNATTSRLGIPLSATVASLHTAGYWNLPPARSENQLALQVHLTTLLLTDGEDSYDWEIEGRLSLKYRTGEVYNYLQGNQPVVPWAKIVWFSFGIPRHSFLTWLVLLNRCPTRDRLNS